MRTDLAHTRRVLTLRYAQFSFVLVAVFAAAIYTAVADARGDLTRSQLRQLAAAAVAQLPQLRRGARDGDPAPQGLSLAPPLGGEDGESAETGREYQRIRWFDSQLHELAATGDFRPGQSTIPAAAARRSTSVLPLRDGLALWQPVFTRSQPGAPPQLEGYVSVALSTRAAEIGLECLRDGLIVGSTMAALVALGGGQWLVAVSLRPIRDQLERLARFTADASHELRHPLTAIRALVGTLREGPALQGAQPVVARKLELIDRTTDRMAQLVDDLLLLARSDCQLLEHGAMSRFPLEELIEDLTTLYGASAHQRGVQLTSQIDAVGMVSGHPERLRQLLVNLISNALRFSPPGGTVTVGLAVQGSTVQVWVDDQGPGIPPEQRELVFQPFWQADAGRSVRGSTGLGLAIARAIAAAHRGRLVAAEAPGGGCRMLLGLPRLA